MHPDIKLLFDNYSVSKYNSCTLQVSILNIREGFFVKESRLRLRSAGLLSVAAGFMLFLYAPLEIYFNNKYEFWFDFYKILKAEFCLVRNIQFQRCINKKNKTDSKSCQQSRRCHLPPVRHKGFPFLFFHLFPLSAVLLYSVQHFNTTTV